MSAKPIFAVAVLLLFAGVSILGVGMSMMTDAQGHMSNCPFMTGTGSICQMNVVDHLSHWQALFTALSPTNSSVSFILLLALAFIAFTFGLRLWRTDKTQITSVFYRQTTPILFNPLRMAFAKGVLHPKIYNLAAIR